jgi:ribonuclease R
VIESRRRATYNEIQDEWLANKKDPSWEYAAHFALYQILRKVRSVRGSIDFDLPEADVRVDETGDPVSISLRSRLDAHRLIEEFMIAANEAVTSWIMERKWPFIFRVHEEPAEQSLQRFQELAATVGISVSISGDNIAATLSDLVSRLEGHPAQFLLNTALLRSMRQAVYSSVHAGHFGLASPAYTHFTSPIRRYPDLVVHRMLRRALRVERHKEPKPGRNELERLERELEEIAEHCSYRERIATNAEREAIKLKQVRMMTKHLGDEFEGKIIGMVESGFFVEIREPYVEGLVSVESMTDDFYQFNEERMVIAGKRKKRTFQIGDQVAVRCLRADIDRRQIDFGLVDLTASAERPAIVARHSGRKKRRGR